jgi:GNAT superfamily N-acetyltransferase
MGLTPVPDDQLAAVVTSLEMRSPPRPAPQPPSPLSLVHWPKPDSERYRTLFRRVGARWLWFSRLVMPEDQLRAILDDSAVEVYAVTDRRGVELGMLELDFRQAGECELSFVALVPELIGKGHGRWLMQQALMLAWRDGRSRVWLHSCTLDHPRALQFYRDAGFTAYRRTVETFVDPRIAGLLPEDCAPQLPLLSPASRR